MFSFLSYISQSWCDLSPLSRSIWCVDDLFSGTSPIPTLVHNAFTYRNFYAVLYLTLKCFRHLWFHAGTVWVKLSSWCVREQQWMRGTAANLPTVWYGFSAIHPGLANIDQQKTPSSTLVNLFLWCNIHYSASSRAIHMHIHVHTQACQRACSHTQAQAHRAAHTHTHVRKHEHTHTHTQRSMPNLSIPILRIPRSL